MPRMSACVLRQEVPAGPIDARTVLGNVQPWSYCFYVLVDLDANLAPAFTRPSRGNASYTQSRCRQCSYVGRLSRRCAPLDANAPSSPSVRTAIWTMLEFSRMQVRLLIGSGDAGLAKQMSMRTTVAEPRDRVGCDTLISDTSSGRFKPRRRETGRHRRKRFDCGQFTVMEIGTLWGSASVTSSMSEKSREPLC
jgi:hypothetical protein